MMLDTWAVAVAGAYLLGSVPFGFLLGRARGLDIREHGSRNIGATNVGRVLGRRLGILCFVLDALKGAVPVTLAGLWHGTWGAPVTAIGPLSLSLWLLVAVAALIGHLMPVWLRFRGGKGVATGFGALVAMWPVLTVPALVSLVIWGLMVGLFRYVSLASVVAALGVPLTTAIVIVTGSETAREGLAAGWPALGMTAALALLVLWRHRANLRRLVAGAEPKIGSKRPNSPPPPDA